MAQTFQRFAISIALFLVSCSAPSKSMPTTITLPASPQATLSHPNITSTPTRTLEPVAPTVTATPVPPTFTLTPTQKPPTPTPIPTKLPTLSATEAFDIVAQLELDNGGCQFPCWWGIIPGKSKWTDAAPFLQSLAFSFFAAGEEGGLKIYEAVFHINPLTGSLEKNKHVIFFVNQEDTIEVVVAGRKMNVNQLLEIYGKPAQIWIHPDGFPTIGTQVFYVKFFYPEQGMIAWNTASGIPKSSQNMQVCLDPYENNRMGFYFFKPDINKPFETIPDENSQYPTEKRELEEVSELNPDTFYKTFIQPDANPCSDILKDAWPADS